MFHPDLILPDEFIAKLDEDNNLFLDTIDSSIVFKRETANTLDILNGDDEDLDNLLFKTVNAQIKVSTTTNKTNTSTNQKNMLISQNAEFGDFFKNLQLLFDAIAILIRMRACTI